MVSSDAALGLAVFFMFMAMMSWGAIQTIWPAGPQDDLPGGGHRVRGWNYRLVPAAALATNVKSASKEPLRE